MHGVKIFYYIYWKEESFRFQRLSGYHARLGVTRGCDVVWHHSWQIRSLNMFVTVYSKGGERCWAINLLTRGTNWMLLLKGEHNRTSSLVWEVAPLDATAKARGSDSDWWVCCGLALNLSLTLSRSGRILNALGKQSESSVNPPQRKCFFNKRKSENTTSTVGISTHTQTSGFVRRSGFLEQCVFGAQLRMVAMKLRKLDPGEGEAKCVMWFVAPPRPSCAQKTLFKETCCTFPRNLPQKILLSIAIFFILLSLLPQYQHLQTKAMLSL